MKKNNRDIFASFTKRASIIKSYGVEIEPTPETQDTITRLCLEEYDEINQQQLTEAMPYFDMIFKKIINTGLDMIEIDFEKKVELDKISKAVSKTMSKACMEVLGISPSKIKNEEFIKKIAPEALKTCCPDYDTGAKKILNLKGKTAIAASYFTSRITALETWVPERIVENFERYCENMTVIKKLLDSPIGDDILSLWPEAANITEGGEKFYSDHLSQSGIDAYNTIINGIFSKHGIEKKGIKLLVNEYNNQTGKKLPEPKELYSQILMPKKKSFSITRAETDLDALTMLNEAFAASKEAGLAIINAIDNANADDVVCAYKNLGHISHTVTGVYHELRNAVREHELGELFSAYEDASTDKARNKAEKELNAAEKQLGKSQFTFAEIERFAGRRDIFTIFKREIESAYQYAVVSTEEAVKTTVEILNKNLKIRDSKPARTALVEAYEAWTRFRHMVNSITRNNIEKGDNALYNTLVESKTSINMMYKSENATRSLVTRSPKDASKNILSVLGMDRRPNASWIRADGEEYGRIKIDNFTVLSRNGQFYYFVLAKGTKPQDIRGNGPDKARAQNKSQDPMKFLPDRVFRDAKKFFNANPDADMFEITQKVSRPVSVSREFYEMYERKEYTKAALEDNSSLTKEDFKKNVAAIIDKYKEYISVYEGWKSFNIITRPTEQYDNIKAFCEDVATCTCKVEWIPVDPEKIDKLVAEGKALMFLMTSKFLYAENRDKNSYAQLLYNALLNPAENDLLLSSRPHVSFRKKSITKPVVHEAGSILVNKHDINGNRIPGPVYLEIKDYYNTGHNKYLTDLSEEAMEYIRGDKVVTHKAKEDIIKDRRYTADKYFISFALTKNASVSGNNADVNQQINAIKNELNLLTITRSEKDLIYYTVTTKDGKLLESRSLNVIDGRDHWAELKEISDQRKEDKSRKWEYETKVKDKRDAYMSLAITQIVRKVIEYNALIVIEHISDERKDRFSAFDNQMYKAFEGKLTSRLSDLHFRDIPLGEPGSRTNPYQLCTGSGDFQDGIVYYVDASYTSADLKNGFLNLFDVSKITNSAHKRFFLSKFKEIKYDEAKDRFLCTFNYDDFMTKKVIKDKIRTIEAGGPYTKYNREYKYNEYIPSRAKEVKTLLEMNHNMTEDFAKLAFEKQLSSKESEALYEMIMQSVKGLVYAHDDVRKKYISPIDGSEYDYAENTAFGLTKKFLWMQEDKETRGEWVQYILDHPGAPA